MTKHPTPACAVQGVASPRPFLTMPKRRKGHKYTPELPVLVRAVLRTTAERESKLAKRESELAKDDLLSMYFDHLEQGKVDELSFQVRVLCEQWIESDDGVRKGGRPSNNHQRLIVAVAVGEAIAAQSEPNVTEAARYVKDNLKIDGKHVNLSVWTIRRLYYHRDPEWQRAIEISLAERRMKPWWTPEVEEASKDAAEDIPHEDFQWWIAGCPT